MKVYMQIKNFVAHMASYNDNKSLSLLTVDNYRCGGTTLDTIIILIIALGPHIPFSGFTDRP